MLSPGLVRIDMAADRLGITIADVYVLIDEGEFTPTALAVEGRLGPWVHIPADQVDAYANGRAQ